MRETSQRAEGEGQRGRLELVTRGRRGRGISATRGIRGVSSVSGIFSVDGPVGTGRGEVRCKSLKEREGRSPGKRGRQQAEEEEPELLWPGQLFVCFCDVRGCTVHLLVESGSDVTSHRAGSHDPQKTSAGVGGRRRLKATKAVPVFIYLFWRHD